MAQPYLSYAPPYQACGCVWNVIDRGNKGSQNGATKYRLYGRARASANSIHRLTAAHAVECTYRTSLRASANRVTAYCLNSLFWTVNVVKLTTVRLQVTAQGCLGFKVRSCGHRISLRIEKSIERDRSKSRDHPFSSSSFLRDCSTLAPLPASP